MTGRVIDLCFGEDMFHKLNECDYIVYPISEANARKMYTVLKIA